MSVKKPNLKNPLNNVEEIFEYRKTIEDPKKALDFVNKVRDSVQKAAVEAIKNGPRNCIVAMATGAGKTKVAIDYARSRKKDQCLLVPTEKLRDSNWQEEYKKWSAEELGHSTEKYCYASATKIIGKIYDLAILDEGHNITENNSGFFNANKVKKSLLLTATVPDRKKDSEKYELLEELCFEVVFELTLDQAVKLGFVAPYEINVIQVPLETSKKEIEGGTKKKPFMTTELSMYNWLSGSVKKLMFSPGKNATFMIMKRMRFIYNLPSKEKAAKYLLDNVIPKEDRTIIFASSIRQAEELCDNYYHSKSSDEGYNKFKQGKANRMSCIKAINEGHNFEGIDGALVTQLTSKEKDLIQRIGRLVRIRPGHKAKVFILVALGTQDEKWLNTAIENLDQESIYYYPYQNIDKYKFYGD